MLLCECAIFLVKGSNHSEIDSRCCSNVTEKASGFGYISLTLQGVGHIMKKTLLLLAMFSAAVGSAQAADMPVKAPVYVAPFTWTGIYLGINAGYGWSSSTSGDEFCTNPAGVVQGRFCNAPSAADLKPKGGFVGGQLGANYQTGMFVWGVESDIQVAHINDSTGALTVPCCVGANLFPGTLTRSQNLDWFGTVRGRLGLAIWDRTLIYGTGGVMYGEEVVDSLFVRISTYDANSSSVKTGWVAGGGIEYAFTNNISAKVEGLYFDMGSETIAATQAILPGVSETNTNTFKYSGALVRLGANLKFGP
jgi:outer membrane immunogenic protein